jgi:hypothetical protein
MHCWLKGTEAGELAARDGWTPDDSRSIRSFRPSEVKETLQPVTLWYATPQEALRMAGVQGVVEKDTGQLFYGSVPPEEAGNGAAER